MTTLAAGSAESASLASDLVFPKWQGTAGGTAAVGHEMDCSDANDYWPEACELTIYTVTDGANCYRESVFTPTTGGVLAANTFDGTQCEIRLKGRMTFEQAHACVYTAGSMFVERWRSGINSTLFSVDLFPVTATMSPVTTPVGALVPGTYKLAVTSNVAVVAGHAIKMDETFFVNFNKATTSCPSADTNRTLKANIYDELPNFAGTTSTGYFLDSYMLVP